MASTSHHQILHLIASLRPSLDCLKFKFSTGCHPMVPCMQGQICTASHCSSSLWVLTPPQKALPPSPCATFCPADPLLPLVPCWRQAKFHRARTYGHVCPW